MLHDAHHRRRVRLKSILARRHARWSFFTCRHFGKRQQRVWEIRRSGWRVAWRYLTEVGAGSLRAGGYRRLLEENTESGLELPMRRLQQLLRLLPGTARGQHKLIDHHLLPKCVHFFVSDHVPNNDTKGERELLSREESRESFGGGRGRDTNGDKYHCADPGGECEEEYGRTYHSKTAETKRRDGGARRRIRVCTRLASRRDPRRFNPRPVAVRLFSLAAPRLLDGTGAERLPLFLRASRVTTTTTTHHGKRRAALCFQN